MLLCKSTQPRKQTMIIVMRQPWAINISGQIKLCSDPFNRRSLYKLPVMLPLGCRAASCLMMQTADVFSEGRGGRMRSLVLFSKKSVYRMCLFSLTELELPEMQSVCISHICGLVKMFSCLWSVTVPEWWWWFIQLLLHAVYYTQGKKTAQGDLTKALKTHRPQIILGISSL